MAITSQTATALAATAVSIVVPANAGVTNVLQFVELTYSGATSGPVTLSITDGATLILAVDLNLTVATPYVLPIPVGGIAGTAGNSLTVAVTAGAASSIAKLSIGRSTV